MFAIVCVSEGSNDKQYVHEASWLCVSLSCRLWASYSLACVSVEPGGVSMSSTALTSLCSL